MAGHRDSIHSESSQILTPQAVFPVTLGKSRVRIDWPITFDEILAELMGMLIHNAKVARNENSIQIRNTSKFFEFEDRLSVLLENLGLELNVKSRYWTGMFQQQAPRISNAEFTRTFLDMLGCDRLTQLLGVEKIPAIVKNSPLEIQKAFLVGYLSTCPAKFVVEDGKKMVCFIPYMETFVTELVAMLHLQNVKCSVHPQWFITDFGEDIEARKI